MKSLQGQLLIATGDLQDQNFARSVVLLVRHGEDGAMGLILNRLTPLSIKQVWTQVSESPCESKDTLHMGGPCQGSLMALHSHALLSEMDVMPGLFFSTGRDNLEQLVLKHDGAVRFYVGYAGWGPAQLESEIDRGSWLTLPATLEHVFHNESDLWRKVTRDLADATLVSDLKIRHVPKDPSWN